MRIFLIFATVALMYTRTGRAALVVKGPTEPVLDGQTVTLECVDTESEFNFSQVHFEKFSKHSQMWYSLEQEEGYLNRWCLFSEEHVKRDEGRLRLVINNMHTWSNGPYRCVSDNATATHNSSESLLIPVHYMRDVSVYRAGSSSFSRYYSSLQDLRVPLGGDVEVECSASSSETPEYSWIKEGEDWVVPSNKLRLEQVRQMDGGQYTCTARNPTVDLLTKSRTISITVLAEDAAWYESTTGRIAFVTFAAGVALLVIVLSMTAFMCRRSKQKTSKGPIDDHSQKKPIYTASVESLPSTAGDKQPLV